VAAKTGFIFFLGFVIVGITAGPLMAASADTSATWWLGVGLDRVDGKWYFSTVARPELTFGKAGLGLDIALRFNTEGVREKDWEDWKQIVSNLIRYIRWGHRGDRLYAHLGVLRDSMLGTGAIMYDYTNLQAGDYISGDKRAGVELGIDAGKAGMELVVNDVLDPGLYAARLYIRPLRLMGEDTIAFRPAELGLTRAIDERPGQELTVNGVDVILPLHSLVQPYVQWTMIQDHGEGLAIGVKNTASPVLNYRVEFRHLERDFVPALFKSTYENTAIHGWEAFNPSRTGTRGFLVEGDLELIPGKLSLAAVYEDTIGQTGEPSSSSCLTVELVDKGLVGALLNRKTRLTVRFSQRSLADIFDFGDQGARIEAQMEIKLMGNVILECNHLSTFAEDGDPIGNTNTRLVYRIGF